MHFPKEPAGQDRQQPEAAPNIGTRWSLRTTFRIAAVLLFAYGLGPAIAYRLLKRAEDDLAKAFQRDLTFLVELPPLQGYVRETDLYTAQFLATGDRAWLNHRDKTLERTAECLGSVLKAATGASIERGMIVELERMLKTHIAEQDEWIRRKSSGRLTATQAAVFLSKQRPLDRLVEMVLQIRRMNVQDLNQRNLAVRRSSIAAFWILISAIAVSAVLLILIFMKFLIDPITRLADYARGWDFDRPWDLRLGPAAPEIQALHARMGQMAQRLADRYKKEAGLVSLKSSLISIISHEFNNALSVIQGITHVLEETEGEPYDGQRRGYYEMIKANTRALALEVSAILNMGRLESGRLAFRYSAVDPVEIVEESLRKLRILHERKKLKISIDTTEPSLRVRADREALMLVSTNLLTNAIKYTPLDGRIWITFTPSGERLDRVRAVFEDSGIGMSPEDVRRALSGYYRTADGKKMARGFGIGLSLTRSILAQHGSDLKIETEQNKGSAFSFELPRWDEERDRENGAGDRRSPTAAG